MELAMIGLGRMGDNMAIRLLKDRHRVVAWNRTYAKTEELARGYGAVATKTFQDVVASLNPPRIVWLMLPSGDVTEKGIEDFLPLLSKGDILIDGGNSNFHDTMRRAEKISAKGIHFLDAGKSGGIWGLQVGYCLMVGGEKKIFDYCEPIFKTLAPENGYAYVGPNGAGHFVKMVHRCGKYDYLAANSSPM